MIHVPNLRQNGTISKFDSRILGGILEGIIGKISAQLYKEIIKKKPWKDF